MRLTRVAAVFGLLALAAPTAGRAQAAGADTGLTHAILRADTLLFNAFNSCDTLALARYFADDVEFYHDKGGLTVGPAATLVNINDRCRRIAAGTAPTLTRVRLPDYDAIYPVPGFGAMQIGRHRFTNGAFGGDPAASADFGFAEVWVRRDSTWQLRRVLSYDHH